MKLTSRRTIAGLVAGATLLGGAGAALANGGPGLLGLGFGDRGGGGNQTALLNAVASNLGVTNAKLRTAVKDALKAQVDQQVKDGVLTSAQGTALKQRIDEGTVHVGVGPAGFGFGDLGALDAAASYLGVTAASLRDSLESGKSLADVANDKGKSVSGLQDAIVARATTTLAASVAAGDLTDAQRDTILTRVKNTVDEFVAQVRGVRGAGRPAATPGFRGGPGGLLVPGFRANHR